MTLRELALRARDEQTLSAMAPFNAAANPTAILALLDRVEALERMLTKVTDRLADYVGDYGATPDDSEWPMINEARAALAKGGSDG